MTNSIPRFILTLCAGAAVAAVAFYLLRNDTKDRPREARPEPAAPLLQLGDLPSEDTLAAEVPDGESLTLSPDQPSLRRNPPTDVSALEAQWRMSPETQQRVALAAALAGENDPEAVRAIGRLLAVERQPAVKNALLSGLAEIDPFVAVDERLKIVEAALRTPSAQVRRIALAALDQLDDPRVAPVLQRISEQDVDSRMRAIATEMLHARTAN